METMKLEDVWALYEVAVLASAKKKSQLTEVGWWKNHISPSLGQRMIVDLTKLDYLMLRRGLEDKGLSPQTVHHCLSLLRRILNKALDFTRYNGNLPDFKGVMPKFDNKRQRFFNENEFSILLSLLKRLEKSENWYNISLFAVSTGLRKGEVFNLRLGDINFTAASAAILDTKSNKNRIIHLNDIAMGIALKKRNGWKPRRPLVSVQSAEGIYQGGKRVWPERWNH